MEAPRVEGGRHGFGATCYCGQQRHPPDVVIQTRPSHNSLSCLPAERNVADAIRSWCPLQPQAGAVASIAFGRVRPVVDGNVIRVLSRVRACVVGGGRRRQADDHVLRFTSRVLPRDPREDGDDHTFHTGRGCPRTALGVSPQKFLCARFLFANADSSAGPGRLCEECAAGRPLLVAGGSRHRPRTAWRLQPGSCSALYIALPPQLT